MKKKISSERIRKFLRRVLSNMALLRPAGTQDRLTNLGAGGQVKVRMFQLHETIIQGMHVPGRGRRERFS